MNKVISVKDLQIAYHGNVVLNKVSVEITSGKIVGIIGPNGSGKTTFLKGILDLIPIQSGTISFFGQDIDQIRERFAYVPQRESVDWDFPASVFDVVAMGTFSSKSWWQRIGKKEKEIVQKAIEEVKLTEFTNQQIGQLSGGQQQRVFLARALAQRAELIIMDEPFVGIDMASQDAIIQLMLNMKKEGKTIVMVHHDLSAVAAYFDEVILLKNELIAHGPTQEILQPSMLSKAYGESFLFKQEA